MKNLDVIIIVLKNGIINIITFFVFTKLINYKSNKKEWFIMFSIGLLESIIESLLSEIPTVIRIGLLFGIYGCVIAQITHKKIKYSITLTFVALAITYLAYISSIIITGTILKIINNNIKKDNIIIFILSIILEVNILCQLFKSKRLKDGVSFLKDESKINNIGIIGMSIIVTVIIIYCLLNNNSDKRTSLIFLSGCLLATVCLFIWLKRKITVYYRQRLKERTVEELESEIRARDERICEVVDENSRLAEVNHKFSSRIRALEDFSCKMIERPEIAELMRCEFGNEFADFEEAVKNVSEEFSSEMKHAVIIRKNLPKTGVFGVDNLLEYMCKESAKNGIDFDVKINGNILFMVQKIIDSKMLETLLGDHIKDAIIAINSSQNTYKNILVTIGIVKECYEISIYDTGIEFEIDTLLKLGLERITTHKSTGGSGIGFMTTFETLAKTKASLIIEEKHPITNNDYTKIVRIRFDGKKEYRIKSYRQNEIEGRKVDKRIKFEKT